jgi:hypothetical protein
MTFMDISILTNLYLDLLYIENYITEIKSISKESIGSCLGC